ncbi:hypothetical protein A6302_03454 [Methylobrevis pamukkalensis]|uniref:Uncharacterized protein n=1 Tax=Methylobrevis pamukkalensis TaxID=1439726 RepID=A0A1E3GYV8_9HYPH|nr:hypothetical protein A6302_03454 [Methylobrevis pamukkalensis]
MAAGAENDARRDAGFAFSGRAPLGPGSHHLPQRRLQADSRRQAGGHRSALEARLGRGLGRCEAVDRPGLCRGIDLHRELRSDDRSPRLSGAGLLHLLLQPDPGRGRHRRRDDRHGDRDHADGDGAAAARRGERRTRPPHAQRADDGAGDRQPVAASRRQHRGRAPRPLRAPRRPRPHPDAARLRKHQRVEHRRARGQGARASHAAERADRGLGHAVPSGSAQGPVAVARPQRTHHQRDQVWRAVQRRTGRYQVGFRLRRRALHLPLSLGGNGGDTIPSHHLPRGFGTKVLGQFVPASFQGKARIEFTDGGMRYEIVAPAGTIHRG